VDRAGQGARDPAVPRNPDRRAAHRAPSWAL